MSDHQALQHAFAAHLRNPDQMPPPEGVEDRRMAIYRRLFFNNILSFLSQAFPVLSQAVGDEAWRLLVRRFYAEHRSQQAQFYRLAEEFVDFLSVLDEPELPAFAAELAHYEWLELALSVAPGKWPLCEPLVQIEQDAELMLTPHLEVLSYQWPVHQISADFQPQQAPEQASFLLIYRARDESVHFKQLNALSARLIELLRDGAKPLSAVLAQLAKEADMSLQALAPAAIQTLNGLLADGVVLGQKPRA